MTLALGLGSTQRGYAIPTFHRLKNATDFKRVRRDGRSHAHPLVVAIVCAQPQAGPQDPTPLSLAPSRFGFVAGRALGSAVKRNRLKRQLRAAVQTLWPQVVPGWDILFIARAPSAQASFGQIQAALAQLLQRARLISQTGLPTTVTPPAPKPHDPA